jgi:transcriptional regulator with XRE-family HTH domain
MDWQKLIAELQDHGYTQPQIAAACGCGQSTVSELSLGKTKEPRHSLGEALRALHAQVTGAWDGIDRRKAA